jgi:hypothetical protein
MDTTNESLAVPDAPPYEYPCPCCGYFTFAEEPGSYDICGVCGWEDDLVQLRFPSMGGANEPLLNAQQRWVDRQPWQRSSITPEDLGYRRDPAWRPLDPEADQIEGHVPGKEYGRTYADDRTTYYYWRHHA